MPSEPTPLYRRPPPQPHFIQKSDLGLPGTHNPPNQTLFTMTACLAIKSTHTTMCHACAPDLFELDLATSCMPIATAGDRVVVIG